MAGGSRPKKRPTTKTVGAVAKSTCLTGFGIPKRRAVVIPIDRPAILCSRLRRVAGRSAYLPTSALGGPTVNGERVELTC